MNKLIFRGSLLVCCVLSVATFVHFLHPLLQSLSKIWKDAMTGHISPHISSNESSTQLQQESDDCNIDSNALVTIVNCFSYLIMLTKQSGEQNGNDSDDGSSTVQKSKRKSSSTSGSKNKTSGFGRREILCVALKEGRVFMEQFIRTSKVNALTVIIVM